MANLIIKTTDKMYKEKGRLTFSTELTSNGNIIISGQMTTHKFIEGINKIETHRYILSDVQIVKETFGSDDFDILYDFIAKDYFVKNGETNLSNELIESIEETSYSKDDSKKWEGDE